MIKEFVDRFTDKKAVLEAKLSEKHPEDYEALVKTVIELVTSEERYAECNPDPTRVHEIDDGDYQGTLVFVIGAKGYQPDKYWYVKVIYGSCSGCDTLECIRNYDAEPPKDEQIKDYMTLALHIVQGLKLMEDVENE